MARKPTRALRRSPRLKETKEMSKSKEISKKESTKIGEISSVRCLLSTGLLEGAQITYISNKDKIKLPGVIKGNGYLCGCSECNYRGEVLSALRFEKHACASTLNQNDHIFFSNGKSLFEIVQHLKNVPQKVLYDEIEKIKRDLNFQEKAEQEETVSEKKDSNKKRNKRKRRKTRFCDSDKSVIMTNKSTKTLRKSPRQEDASTENEEIVDFSGKSAQLEPISSVKDILQTGLLEGLSITFVSKENQVELSGVIKGDGYLCGCPKCNYRGEVLSARKLTNHASDTAFMPNAHIFLSNGKSMYHVLQYLKNVPECDLYKEIGKIRDGLESLNVGNVSQMEKLPLSSPVSNELERSELIEPLREHKTSFHPNRRSQRKRRETGFNNLGIAIENESTEILRRSTRIKGASTETKAKEVAGDGCSKVGVISSVKDILVTGLLEGAPITFVSKEHQVELPGIIKGNEYLCGCSECNYCGEVLSARKFAKHARADVFYHNDHIFLSNGKSMYQISHYIKKLPESDLYGELFKFVEDLKINGSWKQANVSKKQELSNPSLSSSPVNNEMVKAEPIESLMEPKNSYFVRSSTPTPKTDFENRDGALISAKISDPTSQATAGNTGENKPIPNLPTFDSSIDIRATECTGVPVASEKIIGNNCNSSLKGSDLEAITNWVGKGVRKIRNKISVPKWSPSTALSKDVCASLVTRDSTSSGENALTLKIRLPVSGDSAANISQKKRFRDDSLHQCIFKEGGLLDGTVLTYCIKGEVLLTGYKHRNFIVCACHNYEFKPSQFEAHAGEKKRRRPYQNIYTSDGKSLDELSRELIIAQNSATYGSESSGVTKNTNPRLTRVLQTQENEIICCTICKDGSTNLGVINSKLIIFCNQCDKAYHVGCLDNDESFNLEDVFSGNWFCCNSCSEIHSALRNLSYAGLNDIPAPLSNIIKGCCETVEESSRNLYWKLLSGGNHADRILLFEVIRLIRGVFEPIIGGNQDLIQSMVFAKEVDGEGLDFRGMFCVVIVENKQIVSVAMLRVFGCSVAELPLVATHKDWQRKGYFQILLVLIEKLLGLLQVGQLIAPVDDVMQFLWIDKFEFIKSTEQKVQMLTEQHPIMIFEKTTILEKAIPAISFNESSEDLQFEV